MKHLYKSIGLFFLFIGSIIFFAKTIPEATAGTTKATTLQNATFPIMYIEVGDHTINTLHGYSSDLNSGKIRESITPLDTSKTFTISIDEMKAKSKSLITSLGI